MCLSGLQGCQMLKTPVSPLDGAVFIVFGRFGRLVKSLFLLFNEKKNQITKFLPKVNNTFGKYLVNLCTRFSIYSPY